MVKHILLPVFMLACTEVFPQYSEDRKLVLLADYEQHPKLIEQNKILKTDPAGIAERDIVIKIITPASDKKSDDRWMKDKQSFRVILIGKDGGEKFYSNEPISLQQLYSVVDAMPMRKHEMKEAIKQKH